MGDKDRDRREDSPRPDRGDDGEFKKHDRGTGPPGREEDTLPDRDSPPRK